MGSLLEVGTGFHPEATGRENIFLNGAILGMRRREIERQFEAMVEFAGVERFLDTPVKRYSSGMYVRLAFAVAAHLEPEILIVDEVLAVGDAAFQKKCLGKMGDVAKQGRTILFVSHNLGAVSHLCTTGFVLGSGKVVFHGSARDAVDFYNHEMLHLRSRPSGEPPHVLYHAPENAEKNDFVVTRIEILDTNSNPKSVVATWDDLVLRVWFSCKNRVQRGSVELELAGDDGSRLLLLSTQPDGNLPLTFEPGEQCVDCVVDRIPLAAGEYIIGAGLAIPGMEYLWRQQELANLTIVARDVYGSGLAPAAPRSVLAVKHQWREVHRGKTGEASPPLIGSSSGS